MQQIEQERKGRCIRMQEQTAEEREWYIGIDLEDAGLMISYFYPGMQEPETVSLIAGEEQYRIPIAMYRPSGYGSWYLQGADATLHEKDSLYIGGLWKKSLRGEQVHVPQECEAQELFLIYLRKVIRLIPGLTKIEQVQALTFHLKEITQAAVALLKQICWRMGIDKSRVFIQDDKQSFCHFAMNQEKALMQHDVVLFLCEQDALICRYITKESLKNQPKVEILEYDLGELPSGEQERDRAFTKIARDVLQGKIVSSVYLMGSGLEGGWLKDSLLVLCRGRRAFQGKNLYTKGACYESFMQMHTSSWNYRYYSEYSRKNNIFIQVHQGDRMYFLDLAKAGSSCFDGGGSCQVLLDGEAGVDLWMQTPDGEEARIENLVLTDLPARPSKATRLKIELMGAEKGQVSVRITDLGFGAWFLPSGKVWEYCMEE